MPDQPMPGQPMPGQPMPEVIPPAFVRTYAPTILIRSPSLPKLIFSTVFKSTHVLDQILCNNFRNLKTTMTPKNFSFRNSKEKAKVLQYNDCDEPAGWGGR